MTMNAIVKQEDYWTAQEQFWLETHQRHLLDPLWDSHSSQRLWLYNQVTSYCDQWNPLH